LWSGLWPYLWSYLFLWPDYEDSSNKLTWKIIFFMFEYFQQSVIIVDWHLHIYASAVIIYANCINYRWQISVLHLQNHRISRFLYFLVKAVEIEHARKCTKNCVRAFIVLTHWPKIIFWLVDGAEFGNLLSVYVTPCIFKWTRSCHWLSSSKS